MYIQKNFKLKEFACKCGCDGHHYQVMNVLYLSYFLQKLRSFIGSPVQINSGYRCPVHNKRVGGADRSLHTHALAADIVVPDWSAEEIAALVSGEFMDQTGVQFHVIAYPSFVHLDLRTMFAARMRAAKEEGTHALGSGFAAVLPGATAPEEGFDDAFEIWLN